MRAIRYKSGSNGIVERIDVKLQKRDLAKIFVVIVVAEMFAHRPISREQIEQMFSQYKEKVLDQVGLKEKDPEDTIEA